jgi:hypothetical protein
MTLTYTHFMTRDVINTCAPRLFLSRSQRSAVCFGRPRWAEQAGAAAWYLIMSRSARACEEMFGWPVATETLSWNLQRCMTYFAKVTKDELRSNHYDKCVLTQVLCYFWWWSWHTNKSFFSIWHKTTATTVTRKICLPTTHERATQYLSFAIIAPTAPKRCHLTLE